MTKEKYAWSGLGVPLKWLAELDSVPAPNALADAVGDRYLYRYCPVFTRVRDAAVGLGYRFSAEDTPLWRDYQAFPLVALQRILSERVIPYFDTGVTFCRLIEEGPSTRLPPGFVASSMKRNYVFHESGHCVAHDILQNMAREVRAVVRSHEDGLALEAVLAESFANTVESLGSIFVHMSLSDSVFYQLNSHTPIDEKRKEILDRVAAGVGEECRFTLLFLAYFEANLTGESASEDIYGKIAEAAGCTGEQSVTVRETADVAFRLSQDFRDSTTPSYFDLMGLGSEYRALVESNWLSSPVNQSLARTFAGRLWETIRPLKAE